MYLYTEEDFVCPRCGKSAAIEQILINAEVYTKIRWLDEHSASYGTPEITGYDHSWYICDQCGAVFAESEDELVKQLRGGKLVWRRYADDFETEEDDED